MNTSETIIQQRQKERKALKLFLLASLVGSMTFHAGVMALKVGDRWSNLPADPAEEEEMEVVVEEVPPEQPIPEAIAEVAPPPEPDAPQEVAFAPEVAPPPPLAPESPTPLPKGEDAPSDKPTTTPDAAQPMTNSSGDTNLKVGGGPIFKPFGTGFGFGNTTRPTGFSPLGQPDGKPQGQPGGNPNSTAVRSAPPTQPSAKPKKPVCVSCPELKYRGNEVSPVVRRQILPDGSVKVQLVKSSGNPDVDRETLETMSKWRYDPQTVPEGGSRQRVTVTYEEKGSNFQRQNEERRRQEAGRRQVADQERQQQEAQERQRQQPTTAVEAPVKPSPVPSSAPPAAAPASEQPVAPPPAAAPVEPPPAPVEVAPPPVEPAPAPPEPAPVEAAPASGQ